MEKRWIWPFELEEQIGAGAMGVVYRARFVKNDKKVALKLLPADVAANSTYLARFERELEILKDLRHPHVVHCFGGTCEGAQRFYAMELVEGGTMQSLLLAKGFLSWELAIEYALQVCSALGYAHAQGVIHRDIKPGNLLLTKSGKVKLGDFGLALVSTAHKLTADGKTMGTIHYMAPEQIRGSPPLTHKADLYAFGCVLFEMLTGRPPFVGESAGEILHQHIHQPPPRVTSIALECPQQLEAIINDLLEKDPAKRPADAIAVARRLQEIDTVTSVKASNGPKAPIQPSPGDALTRAVSVPVERSGGSGSASRSAPQVTARVGSREILGVALTTAIVVWLGISLLPNKPYLHAESLWVKALRDSNPAVRTTASRALGELGPVARNSIPALIDMLADPSEDVRSEAALALGKMRGAGKSAVGALIKTQKTDANPQVRNQAELALDMIRKGSFGGIGSLIFTGVIIAILGIAGYWLWSRREAMISAVVGPTTSPRSR